MNLKFFLMCVYIAVFAGVNLWFYWKQLKDEILTKRFKEKAFVIWLFFDILLIAVTAGLVLVFIFSTVQPPVLRQPEVLKVAGGILLLTGIVLAYLAARQVGLLRSFSRSIFTWEVYDPDKSGVFRYFRHPMYLGWFLIFLGVTSILNSVYLLVFSLQGGVYFVFRSKMEEKEPKILARHAEEPGS